MFPLLWITWAASWLGSSWWSSTPEKRVGLRREIGYRVLLGIGGIVLAVPVHRYEGVLRLWHVHRVEAWGCLGLMVAGFAFCWWARVHLGRLWSGTITKKTDHRVVDRALRHRAPSDSTQASYAVFATAAAKGTALGVVGAVLVTVALRMKARIEEDWLRGELGPDAYDAYRRRVPMLVPCGPRAK